MIKRLLLAALWQWTQYKKRAMDTQELQCLLHPLPIRYFNVSYVMTQLMHNG
jgi:hypothetical protein